MTPEQEQAKLAEENKFSLADKAEQLKAAEVIEQEANYFAMCLLMPEDFVIAEMKKIGHFDIEDEIAIAKLAKKFRVSIPIMTIRLGQLMKKGLV